jgi:hypothetical protein
MVTKKYLTSRRTLRNYVSSEVVAKKLEHLLYWEYIRIKKLCGRIYRYAEVGVLLASKILRSEKRLVLENRVQQISKVLLINWNNKVIHNRISISIYCNLICICEVQNFGVLYTHSTQPLYHLMREVLCEFPTGIWIFDISWKQNLVNF